MRTLRTGLVLTALLAMLWLGVKGAASPPVNRGTDLSIEAPASTDRG